MKNLHVMIIGAGIGGLCLAQGLQRTGVTVTVHERTHARTDWLQGYRIHVNPNGSRALQHCLPPASWQAFLAGVSEEGGDFAFTTEQLDDLLRLPAAEITPPGGPENRHYGVSRIALRELLLSGLDQVGPTQIVRPGSEFTHYEIKDDGRVTAYFTDGDPVTADLLVGADGANSRVRTQLLPHARRIDSGIVAIAGQYRLSGSPALPHRLTRDTTLVIPKHHGSFFTAVWRPADQTGGYVLWGYSDAATALPARLEQSPAADLQNLVLDRTLGWSPALRALVRGSDPATINALRVRSAQPVTAWPTGPVTLLGDAIHNMTPMAGVGANTALRDAELLCRNLTEVDSGTLDLRSAVRDYERQMLDYGFAAVKLSLRNAKQAGSSSRVRRAATRAMFRGIAAVPPLRRQMAARLGQ